MDFETYIIEYAADFDQKDWSLLSCLGYLYDRVQFTSDSKNDILDAFVKRFQKISRSTITISETRKRAERLSKAAKATLERKEVIDFFQKIDEEFKMRRNDREVSDNVDIAKVEIAKTATMRLVKTLRNEGQGEKRKLSRTEGDFSSKLSRTNENLSQEYHVNNQGSESETESNDERKEITSRMPKTPTPSSAKQIVSVTPSSFKRWTSSHISPLAKNPPKPPLLKTVINKRPQSSRSNSKTIISTPSSFKEPRPLISFSTNTPHKPLLQKKTVVSLAPSVVPGLKSLTRDLRAQYPDVVQEINHSSDAQSKLASLPKSIVIWLRSVLTCTMEAFIANVSIPLTHPNAYEEKLYHVFRSTLLDFHAMIFYANNQAIERHVSERKFLIELVAPPFKYIEHAFGLATFSWVEKNMLFSKALHFADDMNKPTSSYKVDAFAVVKTDHRDFATIEVSGGPLLQDRQHTLEDAEKTLLEGAGMLQGTLQQYLDASLETAKKLKVFTIQIVVDRIVLIEISIHTLNFKAVEVRSGRWPFSWNSVGEYMYICELLAYFIKQLHDQEEVVKSLANEQRGVSEFTTTTIRQWLKSAVKDRL